MKTAVKSVGLALVAALTCGCAGSPSNEPYVQRVSLTRPELLGGETIRTFSGVVRAAHEVNLGFKTAGQIARIHVEEGDYVRRGELLAELDDADYRLAVEALQIQYDQLKDEVERTKQLFEQKSVSANDFEKASAGLRQLGVQLQANRNKLNYTKLYAPTDGYIQKVNFSPARWSMPGRRFSCCSMSRAWRSRSTFRPSSTVAATALRTSPAVRRVSTGRCRCAFRACRPGPTATSSTM